MFSPKTLRYYGTSASGSYIKIVCSSFPKSPAMASITFCLRHSAAFPFYQQRLQHGSNSIANSYLCLLDPAISFKTPSGIELRPENIYHPNLSRTWAATTRIHYVTISRASQEFWDPPSVSEDEIKRQFGCLVYHLSLSLCPPMCRVPKEASSGSPGLKLKIFTTMHHSPSCGSLFLSYRCSPD